MSTSRRLRLALAVLLAAMLACNLKGDMLWNLAGPQAPADIVATYAAPAAGDASIDECLAGSEAYAFSYESIDREVDGTNAICNAEVTLRNLGREPLSAVVHIAWDNTVEQSQFWEVKVLGGGESWTEHVNESHLMQNAYLRVTHMLVVRDGPECWWLAANAEQPRWEAIATPIDMLTCP
jgi:hypothetical protein